MDTSNDMSNDSGRSSRARKRLPGLLGGDLKLLEGETSEERDGIGARFGEERFEGSVIQPFGALCGVLGRKVFGSWIVSSGRTVILVEWGSLVTGADSVIGIWA